MMPQVERDGMTSKITSKVGIQECISPEIFSKGRL